jgi:DNA-binding response OmpR family regulator
MKKSFLNGKSILGVNDEPGVLQVIEEALRKGCPRCTFDKATTFYEASQLLASHTYDLMILDPMGFRCFDLLERAALRRLPVAIVTARPIAPEALSRSFKMKAAAYLPKDKLAEIVPLLEAVLYPGSLSACKNLLDRWKRFFDSKFNLDGERILRLPWDIYFRG